MTWAYNADSNPASVSYATGGTAGPVESFGYDGLQRETSQTLTSASGTVLASESYGYDSDGNITSESAGGGLGSASESFSYDEADRLASETAGGSTTAFGYDGDGNLTTEGSVTNTYNAQDQLTSSSNGSATTSYSYTLNGELSSVTPSSGSAQSYSFDAYGDLASAGGVSYGYDALGRMVSRTGSSGTTSPVSYLGTSDSIASDGASDYSYDPSGNLTGEEAASGAAGAGLGVMANVHGDVIAAFSPAASTSSLGGSSSYSPYGQATSSGSMPAAGYQGGYTDPTTGLVYMNARWYNPATGGFVSSDTVNGTPIPSTVDGNPYAYANGNPLTNTDPTGHCGWWSGLRSAVQATMDLGRAFDTVIAVGTAATLSAITIALTAGFTVLSWVLAPNAGGEGCNRDVSCDSPRPRTRPKTGGGTAVTELPSDDSWGSPWEGTAEGGSDSSGTVVTTSYVEPPPPPPPPQNCYRAETCRPTADPGWMQHHQRNTNQVINNTSFGKLCLQKQCVTDKNYELKQGPIKGLQPEVTIPGATNDTEDQNCTAGGASWTYYMPTDSSHGGRAQGVVACLTQGGFDYYKSGQTCVPQN